MTGPDDTLLADQVKAAAQAAGFHLAGLAPAEAVDPGPLNRWLAAGMDGAMPWMHERLEKRLDPRLLLPGARTVIALGCGFLTHAHAASSPVALYAQGRDYHATLKDRLRHLRRGLLALCPELKTYAAVDTGPVMEKVWAERAGIGWIGKNGMLINPVFGSHLMLAAMVIDRGVDRYDAPHANRCGSCVACLPACPTQAIVAPGVVDARRCLSHQTIEDRDRPYTEDLRPHAAGVAFGCDQCQRCCPWNRDVRVPDDARFLPRELASLTLEDLAELTFERWDALTRGTAVARARYDGLRRNALIALGALGSMAGPRASAIAARLVDDLSLPVREAARWAAERMRIGVAADDPQSVEES